MKLCSLNTICKAYRIKRTVYYLHEQYICIYWILTAYYSWKFLFTTNDMHICSVSYEHANLCIWCISVVSLNEPWIRKQFVETYEYCRPCKSHIDLSQVYTNTGLHNLILNLWNNTGWNINTSYVPTGPYLGAGWTVTPFHAEIPSKSVTYSPFF